jgi:hypothetical protein
MRRVKSGEVLLMLILGAMYSKSGFASLAAENVEGRGQSLRPVLKAHSFFLYGFEKNERENISVVELAALKQTASILLALSDFELNTMLKAGKIFEVSNEQE